MTKQLISSEKEFKNAAEKENTLVFFKHSVTCPISQAAFREFDAFASEHTEVPSYYLQVQESRPLSDCIAETYGVKHESPQVFVIQNGEVKWHASHSQITKNAIEQHLS
ncbi:bacillithiol system redox-active protein YtxJ [Bacillus sp. ISL-51]|uniref:bacillithiol system redox-active protein YtxJ n=1 Tax=unclassified Bacillus (in: firmicutes) TaxID=185979 RepID=UPI001BE5438D|nr:MULTISPECIES: bacillithiol system redox-active protein YtxJ [unclassified Bacillus (in: firmicutes)]MBT2574062.1 bacillithiol system redox-active protein YtxJ [Bacillus sp. ISL-51]MBT2636014.1 bacillithiol system redox-active protein YtxJ [Bacillus sp. ISL-26]